MKCSQLIESLQDQMRFHGDREVIVVLEYWNSLIDGEGFERGGSKDVIIGTIEEIKPDAHDFRVIAEAG